MRKLALVTAALISVGGIVGNRKMFGTLLTGVDHMRHTHDPERNPYPQGETENGAELGTECAHWLATGDVASAAHATTGMVA